MDHATFDSLCRGQLVQHRNGRTYEVWRTALCFVATRKIVSPEFRQIKTGAGTAAKHGPNGLADGYSFGQVAGSFRAKDLQLVDGRGKRRESVLERAR